MKVRFIRSNPQDFIDGLFEVSTQEQLFDQIRRERSLSDDFDIEEAIKITQYKEYVDPRIAFEKTYQIFVIGVGLVGFCDGALKTITPQEKEVAPEGPYYIDPKVEHGCCWSRSIYRPPNAQEIKEGIKNPIRVLECDASDAKFIRNAMNVAWSAKEKK